MGEDLSRLKSIHRVQSSILTWLLLILEQSLMEQQLLVGDCRQKIGRCFWCGRELCALRTTHLIGLST